MFEGKIYFYKHLIKCLDLKPQKTNPELALRRNIFCSVELKKSEFHFCVLQISQQWGAATADCSTTNPSTGRDVLYQVPYLARGNRPLSPQCPVLEVK